MPTDYVRARNVDEALTHLANGGEASRVIAGGQSLVPMMNLNLASPSLVVDISAIDELKQISVQNGSLRVGAGVTHARLITSDDVAQHAPLLAAAARHIGSPRIRNFGTIGGSMAQADPAAELPLVGLVLDAGVDVIGPKGVRSIPVSEFSLGYYTTALEPGEIIQAISIEINPDAGWGFHEYARRAGDFALVAVAAFVTTEGESVSSASIGVAGVASRPMRLTELEQQLIGAGTAAAPELASSAGELVDPVDDPYVSSDYRKRLTGVLAKRAVVDAINRTRQV